MLPEYYIDLLDDTGMIETTALRCTECGEVIDSVILQNRAAPLPNLTLGAKERTFAQRVATESRHTGKNQGGHKSKKPVERRSTNRAR